MGWVPVGREAPAQAVCLTQRQLLFRNACQHHLTAHSPAAAPLVTWGSMRGTAKGKIMLWIFGSPKNICLLGKMSAVLISDLMACLGVLLFICISNVWIVVMMIAYN